MDGKETPRWIIFPNSTSTGIWITLNFQADIPLTLAHALSDTELVSVLEVNESIEGVPQQGLLQIGNEIFSYTGVDSENRAFTGVRRAQRESAAENHSQGDRIWIIQHDIQITYGDLSADPPSYSESERPIFSLPDSTNDAWYYSEFGSNSERPGSWTSRLSGSRCSTYTGNHKTNVDPWDEVGVQVDNGAWSGNRATFSLDTPCRIRGVEFGSGEMYEAASGDNWAARVVSWRNSGWYVEYNIPRPSSPGVWETWAWDSPLPFPQGSTERVGIQIEDRASTSTGDAVEMSEAVVYIDQYPLIQLYPEIALYQMNMFLENLTTGETLQIVIPEMKVGETLTIDTYALQVDLEGSPKLSALRWDDGLPRVWMSLRPGVDNDLRVTDDGVQDLTLTVSYQERWY